ncbi:uncharacterized protein N7529_009269 [Penicillium soppii]|uniref:uncharacterized protein n=1 Tax=Penicillium soppii TaxID=69789 RepID=UPI002547E160|nr:uncharacterized protein N7529_009269 [Penicillium soppii]KAJ5855325.1 hypothetical protein N7529_009269 [Penicillium soppii]
MCIFRAKTASSSYTTSKTGGDEGDWSILSPSSPISSVFFRARALPFVEANPRLIPILDRLQFPNILATGHTKHLNGYAKSPCLIVKWAKA